MVEDNSQFPPPDQEPMPLSDEDFERELADLNSGQLEPAPPEVPQEWPSEYPEHLKEEKTAEQIFHEALAACTDADTLRDLLEEHAEEIQAAIKEDAAAAKDRLAVLDNKSSKAWLNARRLITAGDLSGAWEQLQSNAEARDLPLVMTAAHEKVAQIVSQLMREGAYGLAIHTADTYSFKESEKARLDALIDTGLLHYINFHMDEDNDIDRQEATTLVKAVRDPKVQAKIIEVYEVSSTDLEKKTPTLEVPDYIEGDAEAPVEEAPSQASSIDEPVENLSTSESEQGDDSGPQIARYHQRLQELKAAIEHQKQFYEGLISQTHQRREAAKYKLERDKLIEGYRREMSEVKEDLDRIERRQQRQSVRSQSESPRNQ